MKKFLPFVFLTIVLGAFGTLTASAQKTETLPAKDLFTQYNEENRTTPGRPGAKISILLKRGNEPERFVSPRSTFYSGDKIKLVLDINFNGYAAILNGGSTGRQNLLFPYLDGLEMVSHRVLPLAGTRLPRGAAWMVFDQNPGTEKVTIIFSKNPIVGITGAENSSVEKFLAEIASKNLSKDLFVQDESDASYYVNRKPNPEGRMTFTFSLVHR